MKELLEAIQKDPQLSEKVDRALKDAKSKMLAKTIDIAKEYGFELTEEDLMEDNAAQKDLSLDELDAVAGGGNCGCFFYGNGGSDNSTCMLTGGGNKCGCFLIGVK